MMAAPEDDGLKILEPETQRLCFTLASEFALAKTELVLHNTSITTTKTKTLNYHERRHNDSFIVFRVKARKMDFVQVKNRSPIHYSTRPSPRGLLRPGQVTTLTITMSEEERTRLRNLHNHQFGPSIFESNDFLLLESYRLGPSEIIPASDHESVGAFWTTILKCSFKSRNIVRRQFRVAFVVKEEFSAKPVPQSDSNHMEVKLAKLRISNLGIILQRDAIQTRLEGTTRQLNQLSGEQGDSSNAQKDDVTTRIDCTIKKVDPKNDSLPTTTTTTTTTPNHDTNRILFYEKLVECNDDPILIKLHELAPLVLDIHSIKVFYTFINYSFRAGLVSDELRQFYTRKCLHSIVEDEENTLVWDQETRDMVELLVRKCQDDGIRLEFDWEKVINDQKHDEQSSFPSNNKSLQNDILGYLSTMEFRVGKIKRCVAATTTEAPSSEVLAQQQPCDHHPSADDPASNKQKNSILSRVQLVGWSLNQFYAGMVQEGEDGHRNNKMSVAAMCAILNACGLIRLALVDTSHTTTPPHDDGRNTNEEHKSVFSRIVDFSDLAHIEFVVKESERLPLLEAFQEGIRIVDDATTGENEGNTTKILVSIMAQVVKSVIMKYNQCSETDLDSSEAANVLLLAVTVQLILRSALFGNDGRIMLVTKQEKKTMDTVDRLRRLEDHCFFSVVERASFLEQKFQLNDSNRPPMSLTKRLSLLEESVLGDL